MLLRIVRHEWRVLQADRTLWLVIALLCALVAYATRTGVRWASEQRTAVADVLAQDSVRIATLSAQLTDLEAGRMERPSPFQDPSTPAAVGRSFGTRAAVLPPAPLAATAIGQGDLFPSYAIVSSSTADPFLRTPAVENPLHLLSGRFDLAFVVVFLLPLLLVAVSYSLLSQEREDGTLALLLTQPLGAGTLVAGKLLARFVLVVGVLVVATLVALLAGGVSFTATGAWGAFGWWVVVVSAYAAFWLLLAAVVNARGRSSAENAMTLATAWLVLTIVVPSALSVAASLKHPVPSRAEMVGVERAAAEEAQEQGAALLAAFYQDHPELAPDSAGAGGVNFAAQSWAVQEEVARLTAPVRAAYDEQAGRQRALMRRMRFLSPALLVQESLEALAGTGEARYRAFRGAVLAFRDRYREFIGARIVRGDTFRAADVTSLPSFVAGDAGAEASASSVPANLAGLLLPVAALAVLVGAQRRRVRERARG